MNLNVLEPLLANARMAILDGALATELERRGANLDDALWSAKLLIEQPDLIEQVHYDYFVAGADVAITSTYQASFEGFAQRGLSESEAADLMRLSVRLACRARDRFWADRDNRIGRVQPLVAASIGPYGAYLADGSEYRGDYGLSVAQLMDFHRRRMAVLVDTDADLLACETIPCRLEAEALVALLAQFPGAVAWMSFSCLDGLYVCHGELLTDCVEQVEQSSQVVAVGINCTPPRFVASLLAAAALRTEKPLIAYPNSGEAWDANTKCWLEGTGITAFGEPAKLWRDAGARLIGGCCRTTPDDIREIAQALRLRQSLDGEL